MESVKIYYTIWKKTGFKRFAKTFTFTFGFLWLLIEPAGLFFADSFDLGWVGYGGLVVGASIVAVVYRLPRRTMSAQLSAPDSTIEITVGDLFDQPSNLVIGTNDVFDTELGDVIEPKSVQGQFLTRVYANDTAKLDGEISAALAQHDRSKKLDRRKLRGKQYRYPIGTTIMIGSNSRRYFLTAYGKMGNNLICESDSDCIWSALSGVWTAVREKGHLQPVAIPIVGSELSRIGLPRMILIRMIVISFLVATRQKPVTRKLRIAVYPGDLESVNFHDVEDFLRSACF